MPTPSESPVPERQESRHHVQTALERLIRLQQSRRVHGELTSASRAQVSQPAVVLLMRLRSGAGGGALAIGDLARLARMDMSLVSRELRKLEADELVTRTTDARDGRITRVGLTPKGRGVVRRLRRVRDLHFEDALSGWTDDELASLGTLMGRFVDDLSAVHYREADETG